MVNNLLYCIVKNNQYRYQFWKYRVNDNILFGQKQLNIESWVCEIKCLFNERITLMWSQVSIQKKIWEVYIYLCIYII